MMTSKQQHRFWRLGLIMLAIAGMTLFILTSLQDNILYFMTPTELLAKPTKDKKMRLGGLVAKGSVVKDPQTLTVHFNVTDNENTLAVVYQGILPDLFREGQGVIAEGKWQDDAIFQATTILAKHDENYQPPELTAGLRKAREK